MRTTPLRIGFDMDGVLADMDAALLHEATVLFGDQLTVSPAPQDGAMAVTASSAGEGDDPSTDVDPTAASEAVGAPPTVAVAGLEMTARQWRRLWRHVATIDNFWETLAECEPGMVASLSAVATARRWEIIFLTKRPASAGASAQLQTQRWLVVHGFALPSVFVVQRSRGRIAAALELDIVIDDRPDGCLDVVVDSKARAMLVWRTAAGPPPPATQRLGIGVVRTVAECLDTLIAIDEEQPELGMVARFMRRFGFTSPLQA